ncbi:primosomal replication protein PriB/PriC domain protein [Edwardsiella tarda]|uniref:Primosomal replication protein PriB/PriC domain protein n=2 Tax=Edwardsiella tarda TaxID=636 RepID=A0A2A7U1D5_EDWTA|nr:primosomal replication protein PriB/PriC domain protein [Edwardsiella tarda]PEH72078.1 primosomal replication protein PriB/PriC domain protein [Edwardsiella tarda]
MTREELEQRRQAYLDAERAVLMGKSISINGQEMTMESLSVIRKGLEDIDAQLRAKTRPRSLHSVARFQ